MPYALFFLTGLIIGSFLNVCIYRVPRGESIVFPPSRCPKCGQRLKPKHLIPVVSFIMLSGKCSYCRGKISPVYPAVEITAAVLFTVLFSRFGMGLLFLKYSLFASLLIVISFIDLKTQIIPDSLIVTGLVSGLAFTLIDKNSSFLASLVGALLGSGILLLIAILSRGGMGGGDVKLMAVIGLFLGWRRVLVTLFIGFLSGGIISLFLLLTRKKGRKDAIPFGPFLSTAALVSALYGEEIIYLYLNLVAGGGIMPH